MLLGHIAPFLKSGGMVHAGMGLTGTVCIVIGTVRELIVLLSLFQDVIPILLGCAFYVFAVDVGKAVFNYGMDCGSAEDEIHVGAEKLGAEKLFTI